MSSEIQKVVAYITNGCRLLVFRHSEFPEAGIQVPAGTVETGEALETAVLREAHEETGLEDLALVRYLGSKTESGIKARHFFHLHCPGHPPSRWRHSEQFPSEGPNEPIEFELYWVNGPDEIPSLAGEQDALLAAVVWDRLP